jgi:hypothetical protein
MKGNPAALGGLLTSKPTWSNSSGYSTTSAFFACCVGEARHAPGRHRMETPELNKPDQNQRIARPPMTSLASWPSASAIAWPSLLWIGALHLGALLALVPSYFSWTAVGVCLVLHWLTGGIGI